MMADTTPIQRIYFGPPGSGKSHAAKTKATELTGGHVCNRTIHMSFAQFFTQKPLMATL
jgi:AAA+ superfamily predicted ATPase